MSYDNENDPKNKERLREYFKEYDPDYYEKMKNEKVTPIRDDVTESSQITIGKMSDVVEKKIDWLWKNVIAFGKITVLAGEPGTGKSSLLIHIASIVSNGSKFHGESIACTPANVLIISAEDNADDTMKPRITSYGGDSERIDYVKGIEKLDKRGKKYYDSICLIENLFELEDKIIENKYKLIIVDPITAYLGTVDDTKNKEIRSAMAMLQALVERHGIALLLNSHFTKPPASGSRAIYRIMGSVGFAAAPRIVYGVMKDPEDEERRIFKCIKNNIGKDSLGLVYKIKQYITPAGIETNQIEWLDETVSKTANEILNTDSGSKSPKLKEAIEFLQEILKSGSMSVTEIRAEAEKRSISPDRLYAAKKSLNVQETQSVAYKRGKIWML